MPLASTSGFQAQHPIKCDSFRSHAANPRRPWWAYCPSAPTETVPRFFESSHMRTQAVLCTKYVKKIELLHVRYIYIYLQFVIIPPSHSNSCENTFARVMMS